MFATILGGFSFGEGIHWEMPCSNANIFGTGGLSLT